MRSTDGCSLWRSCHAPQPKSWMVSINKNTYKIGVTVTLLSYNLKFNSTLKIMMVQWNRCDSILDQSVVSDLKTSVFEFILLETIHNTQVSVMSNLTFIHGINKCSIRESERKRKRERSRWKLNWITKFWWSTIFSFVRYSVSCKLHFLITFTGNCVQKIVCHFVLVYQKHPAGDNSCTTEMFKPTDDQPYTTKFYITTKG
jgi:hypothetical protein